MDIFLIRDKHLGSATLLSTVLTANESFLMSVMAYCVPSGLSLLLSFVSLLHHCYFASVNRLRFSLAVRGKWNEEGWLICVNHRRQCTGYPLKLLNVDCNADLQWFCIRNQRFTLMRIRIQLLIYAAPDSYSWFLGLKDNFSAGIVFNIFFVLQEHTPKNSVHTYIDWKAQFPTKNAFSTF